MKPLSRRRKWTAGVALSAMVAASGLTLLPRERLLMVEAKQVSAVNIGTLAPNRVRFLPCTWRTDHTVIVMVYRADGDRFEFIEVDADNGVQTPLTTVNQKCRSDLRAFYWNTRSGTILPPGVQLSPLVRSDPPIYGLSPDGRRLIFGHWEFPTSFTHNSIALDGTENRRTRSSEHWTRPVWLPDNHRWLEPIYKGNDAKAVVLHDTRKPTQNLRIPISGAEGAGYALGIIQSGHLLGVSRNSGQLVASVQMLDCAIFSPDSIPVKYTVRFPRLATLRGVQLSTKRDRLAWVLFYDNTSALSQWLHQALPRLPLPPQPTVGLYVSRLDGADMTEIGHVAASPDGEPKLGYSLQWLPGDKKLSFTYKGALYTVSVP